MLRIVNECYVTSCQLFGRNYFSEVSANGPCIIIIINSTEQGAPKTNLNSSNSKTIPAFLDFYEYFHIYTISLFNPFLHQINLMQIPHYSSWRSISVLSSHVYTAFLSNDTFNYNHYIVLSQVTQVKFPTSWFQNYACIRFFYQFIMSVKYWTTLRCIYLYYNIIITDLILHPPCLQRSFVSRRQQ